MNHHDLNDLCSIWCKCKTFSEVWKCGVQGIIVSWISWIKFKKSLSYVIVCVFLVTPLWHTEQTCVWIVGNSLQLQSVCVNMPAVIHVDTHSVQYRTAARLVACGKHIWFPTSATFARQTRARWFSMSGSSLCVITASENHQICGGDRRADISLCDLREERLEGLFLSKRGLWDGHALGGDDCKQKHNVLWIHHTQFWGRLHGHAYISGFQNKQHCRVEFRF